MGMNQTPSGERIHIGFFGKRNAGKSSLVNAVTGQDLAIVSDVRGTTTDPVYKSMELLPLGPVMIIDTPGIDDEGELGGKRVGKSRQVLNKTDIAVLVADAVEGLGPQEEKLIELFQNKEIPYLVVYNKSDLLEGGKADSVKSAASRRDDAIGRGEDVVPGFPAAVSHEIWVSARTGEQIRELKERMAGLVPSDGNGRRLVGDLVKPSDLVVLVIPIDKAAPKGRLILPQQQVIRDLLDMGANAVICREDELAHVLAAFQSDPSLVITDSQVFPLVAKATPERIRMTSFSILFARYKGDLAQSCQGAAALKNLQDGDRILISEGCTHHRQCDDIGSVKLPRWIREYTGKEPEFSFTSGTEFPDDLSSYRLVVHCGGCMLNGREMRYRLRCASDQNVPMTNYGILIAYMKGILERSMEGLGMTL